jgi:tRNA wybutosine-synthesizing protein 1
MPDVLQPTNESIAAISILNEGALVELGLSFVFMLLSFAAAYFYLFQKPPLKKGEKDPAEAQQKKQPKEVPKTFTATPKQAQPVKAVATPKVTVPLRIIYGTSTGHAKAFAEDIERDVFAMNVSGFHFDCDVVEFKEYDQDNLEQESLLIFVVSTWTGGVPPPSASVFFDWLKDMALDFRVSNTWLKAQRFTVFGLGNSLYDENYCKAALTLDDDLKTLGATPFYEVGKGDDQTDQEAQFKAWKEDMLPRLCEEYARIAGGNTTTTSDKPVDKSANCGCSAPKKSKSGKKSEEGCCKSGDGKEASEGCCKSDGKKGGQKDGGDSKERLSTKEYRRQKRKALPKVQKSAEDILNDQMLAEESDEFEMSSDPDSPSEDEVSDDDEDGGVGGAGSGDDNVDMEDLGKVIKTHQEEAEIEAKNGPQEMVTPMQRRALTKEGYRIIGTHSAVKLCRWTKHQLRGRGGCYKHSFYGITSYQCMEATPSLACANKCVFCWRHHKNPVGRDWRWTVDPPEMILQQAMDNHKVCVQV